MSTSELAVSYAALICADDGIEPTVSYQTSSQHRVSPRFAGTDPKYRPTNSKLSSKPPNVMMSSRYGQRFSPRYRLSVHHQKPLEARYEPMEEIYLTDLQALEGKDVKDMLLNVGSGGGAAAAAPSGGAAPAAGGDEPAAKEEEKKEEGELDTEKRLAWRSHSLMLRFFREGRIGRGHGFRSLRLSLGLALLLPLDTSVPAWLESTCVRARCLRSYRLGTLVCKVIHESVHWLSVIIMLVKTITRSDPLVRLVYHQPNSFPYSFV